MKICLFDPGIENNSGSPSANLGDLIIQEAVEKELTSVFSNIEIARISTHVFPTQEHIKLARSCPLNFVGGTNLLNSNMDENIQWKISFKQKLKLRKALLFGVGWQQYQVKPNLYTRLSLKTVLSGKLFHSVRDNYTKTQLQSAGIKNVLNTGCPTMWSLMDTRPEEIPSTKSENALVMLTDYSKNPELDRKLLELVFYKYEKVFVWPQGRGDREYIFDLLSGLNFTVVMLDHCFDSFKNFLNSGISFDYIGTRLHGGIKCLLSKKRSLIIEIDNRAKEIAKDTNLPTSNRANFMYISQWIDGHSTTTIKMNCDSINRWRSQF
jgi:hypothetical protein